MKTSALPVITLALAGMLGATFADARVYRCTDAAGKISYSQVPCPADQKADEMRGVSSGAKQDKDLCQDARELAMQSFSKLGNGVEPSDLIDEYGGVNYITPATLSVINFVASLRYNQDLTSQRVGSMSFARCREGGFGKLSPGDLPSFDPELDPSQRQMPVMPNYPLPPAEPVAAPAAPAAGIPRHDPCPGYDRRIEALNEQMRQGGSGARMDALHKERERVWDTWSRECRK